MRHLFYLLVLFSISVYAATYQEGKQAYLNQNYAQALKILKPLAKNGNTKAQTTLGVMYDYGYGVKKDPAESTKWYLMAAKQGTPLAQHDIGVRYFQGRGVAQNYAEAIKWWTVSANAGIADSQFNLGLMYYRGMGITKDYIKAAKLFETAAKKGHGSAQYSLAVMYAFGQAKEKSYAKALKWFNKAAEQNVAQAQFDLGVFYENGYGVTKNLKKAKQWYQLAADQGLQQSIEKLKTFSRQNTTDVAMEASNTSNKSLAKTSNELNLSRWLRQQPTDSYTLQFISVTSKENIIKYINSFKFRANVGYIKVMINGATRYNAIYGIYDTHKDAELAINELPKAIQNAKPWVRNTGVLKGLLR